MCGITGIIDFDESGKPEEILQMNNLIKHRGPDDEGYFLFNKKGDKVLCSGNDSIDEVKQTQINVLEKSHQQFSVLLGHRRFSIIDPSFLGHQPFIEAEGHYSLIFNGEIFNYIEIKDSLKSLGHKFKSDSDTEVLLKAYIQWGVKCFELFNGFWAIAILDCKKNSIILSRDRFGIKPLYIYKQKRRIYFSSEIKAIFPFYMEKDVEREAVYMYLVHDRKDSMHDSLWRNIKQVPSAHYVEICLETGREIYTRYWDYPVRRLEESEVDLESSIDELNSLLEDSVRLRLRSDVPIEANLSGGLDSSSIVYHASKILRKYDKRLTVHTIRYNNDLALDESKKAKEIANSLDIDYKEIVLNADDVWKNLDQLIYNLEEPVHSAAFYVQWLAWKQIAKEGYKVILHGSANDELMMGYSYLSQIHDLNRLNKFDIPLRMQSRHTLYPKNVARIIKWILQKKINLIGHPILDSALNYNSKAFNKDFLVSTSEIEKEYNTKYSLWNSTASNRISADWNNLRIPFWVNIMDKSMMSIPIEVRMPFMDYRLVEFAFKQPISYHYHNGWTKYLLRKSVSGKLPSEIVWQKDKIGFTVPKRKWIFDNIKNIESIIKNGSAEDYIDADYVTSNLESIDIDTLWRIINFIKWKNLFK